MLEGWMNMKKIYKLIASLLVLLVCLLAPVNISTATEITSAESAVISIEEYEVEEGILSAGEQITINLTLRNHSNTTDARNIVISFSAPNNDLVPVYGQDNQIYVDYIKAGATQVVSFEGVVSGDYSAEVLPLTFYLYYISGTTPLGNSLMIYVPTYAAGNLVAESTIVTGNATVGAKALVSVRYKNVSTVDMVDVKLIFEGNIEEEGKEIILPRIEAGKTYTGDYNVRFTESGIQTLGLQYHYVDEQGNAYVTDGGEYRINVTSDLTAAESGVIVEQVSEGNTWLMKGLLLAVIGVAAMGVIVMFMKKKM